MTPAVQELETQNVDVETLHTYYRNPRHGNIDAVAASLQRNGQYRAIVVNKGTHTGRPMEVLAGNHTLKAARKLGWDTITAHIIDVDDDQATRIVLADNKTSDMASYDDQVLHDLLEDLDDLDGTAWTLEELEALANMPTDDDWGLIADTLPGEEPEHYTRTFTLTREQADILDAAIDAARPTVAGRNGNENANALIHAITGGMK